MITIISNVDDAKITLNLPTDFNEITPEYLKDVTENIEIADNHVLVGIVFREKLLNIITNAKKQTITTGVIPVFAKAGKLSNQSLDMKPTDRLIVSPTDISRGYHIASSRNKINLDYVTKLITEDTSVRSKVMSGTIDVHFGNNFKEHPYCYFIEFKLIPLCDIKGVYHDVDTNWKNPFVTIERQTNEATN